jgi:biopolymer transport protein ExbB/TolQ
MDRIINYLLLVIIFVFDPLAIALVIAANFAFARLNKREETPIEEKVEDMRNVVEAYDDLQDEIKEYKIYKQQDEPIEDVKEKENDWVIEDEDTEREREVEAHLEKIESLTNDINSAEYFKKEETLKEIKKLKNFLKANNKDETITYF